MRKFLQLILKSFLFLISGIFCFLLLYALVAIILSVIPVNNNFKNCTNGVTIYIVSNNVHTDIVLPIKNACYDWNIKIKYSNTIVNGSSIKFVGFGWGDKGFYLETPTWGDLKFKTTFKALFFMGTSAMHITFYKNLYESNHCKKLIISYKKYLKLVNFIDKSFKYDSLGNYIFIKKGYDEYDAFYSAQGKYNLFYTSNTWANSALKSAGLKAALWTPFDKGILWHY